MKITKQISVFMENLPGNLAKFCAILEENEINIIGISITDAVDHSVVRMVVDDHAKCSHVLGEHSMVVIESEVLQLDLQHRPGELKKIAEILSKEEVNIDYIYGSAPNSSAKAILFLKGSDLKKANEMISKYKSI